MSTVELFQRHAGNPILTAADWPYPVNAVFNPEATAVNGETMLLARVEDRRGISHLTVARSAKGLDGWSIEPEPLLAPDDETGESSPPNSKLHPKVHLPLRAGQEQVARNGNGQDRA